ncbi:hypothetical protein FIV42_10510 [Persicimonas caeni]|uniref:Uncharacterized protein n=1 Tax=Persicimonas caeni TaxID=2292766 RepID=A0A4Y6PS43_PERCE|nr:DUF6261 family protein [Persicimonas caeni]QDG51152.1 hypothetical protein FIV42_10510 [Persicimonas caeni]QED32373.1 hypothetical protein FRD00_10505 [Persicimonas caeni]
MSLRPSEQLDGYQQDTGSKEFCLNDMRPKAEARGLSELVGLIDAAQADLDEVGSIEFDWGQSKTSGPASRKEAVQVDVKLDRSLGQAHTIIDAYAKGESDSPQREAARRIKTKVLPRGVFPITSLKYEQQHAAIKEFHGRMTTTFSADVDTLGLTGLIDGVGRLNADFGSHLTVDANQVTFDQVLDARRKSDDSFALVIMATHVFTAHDPEATADLLAAYHDQQERIAQYQKRRGVTPVVDPGTGEIVDDEGGNAPVAPTPDEDTDPSAPSADDTDSPAEDDVVEPQPVLEE